MQQLVRGVLLRRRTALVISRIAVDASDNIIVSGELSEPMDLGGGPVPQGSFLAKYDPAGTALWSRSFQLWVNPWPPTPLLGVNQLVIAPQDRIAIAGNFRGNIDFGTGPLFAAGERDVFVATYAP